MFRSIATPVRGLVLVAAALFALTSASLAQSAVAGDTRPVPRAIVIGFVGGFVKHDDPIHAEVQLAAQLRKELSASVDVETFESRHGGQARQEILKLLDRNHDGTLSAEEKQSARIILYGHSWGASESIALARALGKDGIPVLLTVQVDSVSRIGHRDTTVPANVEQAVNFYQPHGLVHGARKIRAADPTRTRILGNFEYDYTHSPLTCSQYPWWDRYLVKAHTQIECDPKVWGQVDALIRSNLRPQSPKSPQ